MSLPGRLAAMLLKAPIYVYRYSLSAFLGRNCRHLPTCSEFALEAIDRHGAWPGGWIALARIWRCRPGGSCGYDPVPDTVPPAARAYLPWRYGRWK